MTDPSDALMSFQKALLNGELRLQQGALDSNLFVYFDRPDGVTPRLTYVTLDGRTVTAMAILVTSDPMEGLPCYEAGVAVPERYRGEGRAKNIVEAAIAELKHGLQRNNISTFYVEAIVGVDNEVSKRVAASTISPTANAVTDAHSGLPALHYVRKIVPRS